MDVKGTNASSSGLGLAAATDWSTNDAVDAVISSVESAINQLRDMASEFGNNYSIVQTRQDFTENLINVLEEGLRQLSQYCHCSKTLTKSTQAPLRTIILSGACLYFAEHLVLYK